ncbi:MAG: hypothetical protein R3F19_18275 [Verrucomicrobiales bacterium]
MSAPKYLWFQEMARSGKSDDLTYLPKQLKTLHLYDQLATHDKSAAEQAGAGQAQLRH